MQNNFPATVEEIILSGTLINSVWRIFYTKSDKEKAKDIMEKLELSSIRKKCFYELSGGQKQRVLIARALCSTENTIILDEPTNGLDPKITYEIYKILSNLNKKEQLTVVMISHDVDRCLKYCSRVVKMENGKIILDVPVDSYKKEGGI